MNGSLCVSLYWECESDGERDDWDEEVEDEVDKCGIELELTVWRLDKDASGEEGFERLIGNFDGVVWRDTE